MTFKTSLSLSLPPSQPFSTLFTPKLLVLLILVLQNAALTLLLRQSHLVTSHHASHEGGEELHKKYIPSTAVLIGELLKLGFSLCMCSYDTFFTNKIPSLSSWFQNSQVFFLPALLYYLQNRLIFMSSGLLDSTTFQLVSQFKLITTAFFSVLLLGRRLTLRQWVSLFSLASGIALAQIPPEATSSFFLPPTTTTTTTPLFHSTFLFNSERMLGLLLMLGACCLSGCAGVLIEREFKKKEDNSILPFPSSSLTSSLSSGSLSSYSSSSSASPIPSESLWIRNMQLCLFSLLFGLTDCFTQSNEEITRDGFFVGYSCWTFITILFQALGGIIVALVIKYADNIAKGFATSLAIVVGALGSYHFLGETSQVFSPFFISGATIVCFSVVCFNTTLEFGTLITKKLLEILRVGKEEHKRSLEECL